MSEEKPCCPCCVFGCQAEQEIAALKARLAAAAGVIEAARRLDKFWPPEPGDCRHSDSNILRDALVALDGGAEQE